MYLWLFGSSFLCAHTIGHHHWHQNGNLKIVVTRVLGDFVHQKVGVKIVAIAKGGDFVELQLASPGKASLSFPPWRFPIFTNVHMDHMLTISYLSEPNFSYYCKAFNPHTPKEFHLQIITNSISTKTKSTKKIN
jgi:hypothetical protein